MSDRMIDRTYWAAALLLAIWAVVVGIGAGAADDETTPWFAFFALTGVAIAGGLWLEHRSVRFCEWIVLLVGVGVAFFTFWILFPIVLGLALIATWVMRYRRSPADVPD